MLIGLAAALSFGASTPFAQRLLERCDPQLLAALLYAGAAGVLLAAGPSRRRHEAPVRRSDLPTIALVVVSGGVIAPVLLLLGLQRITALSGSLLLNLESVLTAMLAIWFFGEHLSRRAVIAGVAIVLGAVLVGLTPGQLGASPIGLLLVLGACAGWALDNNLTQRLTVRDPLSVVRIKVTAAAAVNIVIALARGVPLPTLGVLATALALGAVSYGCSVVLDAYALRLLGAAREAAVFGVAPFAGALVAMALGDPLTAGVVVAAAFMILGTGLLLTERHDHAHVHDVLEHDHRHAHDDHHQHDHPDASGDEPHAHSHRHELVVHAHTHSADLHHRHPR